MILPRLAQRILWSIHTLGPMGRRDLSQRLDIRPNTIGDVAGRMIRMGLLREGPNERSGRGRPLVPLHIDTTRRIVLGLAMEPGRVGICRLNLAGQPLGDPVRVKITHPSEMIAAAHKLLADHIDRRVLAIGLTTTGFVDPVTHQVLLSSAMPVHQPVSLQPLYDQAGNLPVFTDNDMHALAAAWLLTHQSQPVRDMLLVELRDGAMGAAMLVAGRPNRGCVISGNEIGHMRANVPTAPCYCGRTGCLERIFSSQFLGSQPGADDDLPHRLASPRKSDRKLAQMINLVADGLANSVNLIRPDRLVLHISFNQHDWLFEQLMTETRKRMLEPLAARVMIDDWTDAPLRFSQSAGWLALAGLFAAKWSTPQ